MSLNSDTRAELMGAIHASPNLNAEQKSALIGLLNERKRYGLVWEDKPEDALEKMRTEIPVLTEVPERFVPGATADSPNHVLIEGDNLHALTALQYTHAGKVDVIYIDPPYNTGNKDFIYNDSFVDKEDTWRHSKWLSFMEKRLRLAKTLLKETGVIFISIDDNEQAQLKLLCDDVFGEENFVDNIIWEKNYAPRNDATFFSASHDFIVVYQNGKWERKLEKRTDELNKPYRYNDNDGRGVYRTGDVLVKSFSASTVFPIVNPKSGVAYHPPKGSCWRFSKETFDALIKDNRIYWGKDGMGAPQVKRYLSEVQQGVVPQTIWFYEDVGHTQDGKNELKEFALTSRTFETPKPVLLLKRIIGFDIHPDALILDFFAGSGTTLHATMALNAEDGGKRQCILVTNNENDICENVTYERNKRVIQGYTNSKGQAVPGLVNNNLRYYKTEFVSRTKDMQSRKILAACAKELISLKENCFAIREDLCGAGFQIFEGPEFFVLMVLDPDCIEEVVEWIAKQQKLCKVFVYSPDADPFTTDFEEVQDKIELCALPDAIYRAFHEVLPEANHD